MSSVFLFSQFNTLSKKSPVFSGFHDNSGQPQVIGDVRAQYEIDSGWLEADI